MANLARLPKGILLAIVLATVPLACDSTTDSSNGDDPASLAAVELTPLADAPPTTLGERAAMPMVLNVWATWCAPCRKEMPAFESVAARYEGSVRFIGVNLGDERASAQGFIDETGVTFDQYLDPDSTAQVALSITTMPATAFIREDGTIAATHNGALDADELEKMIADELDVPTTTGP